MDSTHKEPKISRRSLMRNAGAAAALTATPALVSPQIVEGQENPSDNVPLMRSLAVQAEQMSADEPALPPLAVIVFNRMAFGPEAFNSQGGDFARFAQLGGDDDARLQAYVNEQLNPNAIDDSACDNLIAAQGFSTLNKSLPQLWTDHVLADGIGWEERIRPFTETERATWLRAVYSKRQLQEVLADFWHNHFNIYGRDYWPAPVWVHYDRRVIRANLLGNFRTLLGAVAKSPAMLYYLDNTSNTSAGPNENFARELFELHTLGAENYLGVVQDRNSVPLDEEGRPVGYIDKDVYQATECFTGWTVDRDTGEFFFQENDHSRYEKIVLNQTIGDFLGQQDGEIVLDLLANHPGTARHIARKLCRRLISDTPPESVVQAAADVFYAQRNAPDQLARVVRTILLSEEFRTTWGQKVKRPFEYAASVLRGGAAALLCPTMTSSGTTDAWGSRSFSGTRPTATRTAVSPGPAPCPCFNAGSTATGSWTGSSGMDPTKTRSVWPSSPKCRTIGARRIRLSTSGANGCWGAPCRRPNGAPFSTSWPKVAIPTLICPPRISKSAPATWLH